MYMSDVFVQLWRYSTWIDKKKSHVPIFLEFLCIPHRLKILPLQLLKIFSEPELFSLPFLWLRLWRSLCYINPCLQATQRNRNSLDLRKPKTSRILSSVCLTLETVQAIIQKKNSLKELSKFIFKVNCLHLSLRKYKSYYLPTDSWGLFFHLHIFTGILITSVNSS